MENKEQLTKEINLLKRDMKISGFKVSMNLEDKMLELALNGTSGLFESIQKHELEQLTAERDLLLMIRLDELKCEKWFSV